MHPTLIPWDSQRFNRSVFDFFSLADPFVRFFLFLHIHIFSLFSFVKNNLGLLHQLVFNFRLFRIATTIFLRPAWDFCLNFAFTLHNGYRGSPCTEGCNPIAHASWAVAGWFICGRVPGYCGAVVAGAYRRWRRRWTSSVVRVVMG